MNILNTASILSILVDHKIEKVSRFKFFTELFYGFYLDEGRDFNFTDTRMSKWIHGAEKIPSTIWQYYSKNMQK